MRRNQITEESLGIFWEGKETKGITIYGLFQGNIIEAPIPPMNIWPDGCNYKSQKLVGSNWTVWLWDIIIVKWPEKSDWINIIRRTLKIMIDFGASIGWAGLEGFFTEPPNIFNPEHMSGGVWAAYTYDDIFHCNAEIGEQFKALDDNIMRELYKRFGRGWGP
ncbi:MAG: hypothetical protein M0036_11405 [Desulfobacteraceae bacterium]|nr:hypothetical protein [Desulfobacteraceae bacterium]